MSYGLPWANASNTPFRLFKSFVHEGGIATPLVVHWPAALRSIEQWNNNNETYSDHNHDRICHSPWMMIDMVATCCDLAGVDIDPDSLEGESFSPLIHGRIDTTRMNPIFWEHQGNCAMRSGPWKLVYRRNECEEHCDYPSDNKGIGDLKCWELYNMEDDRTETHNLAMNHRHRVESMAEHWLEWAVHVGVKPWPLKPLPKGDRDWSNLPWLWW
jgi:arylsulfatase A-like enzyme